MTAVERIATAKLSAADVVEIRKAAASGHVSMRGLARHYGVSHTAIQDVVHSRHWTHVGVA